MRFSLSERNAHRIAVVLQSICYLIAILALVTIVLVLLGRMEISLTTPEGHYNDVLLLEKDHSVKSRALFITIRDQNLYLDTTGSGGEVGFVTWLVIALIGIASAFPMGFCFFLLAGFFKNIANAKVFVTRNANILLKCGIVLVAASLIVPVLNAYVFPWIVNSLTANSLMLSVPLKLELLFYGAIFLVMAYVFHYGISLQDEADHTL